MKIRKENRSPQKLKFKRFSLLTVEKDVNNSLILVVFCVVAVVVATAVVSSFVVEVDSVIVERLILQHPHLFFIREPLLS